MRQITRDVLHFHMYDYVSDGTAMSLKLSSMRSASLEVVESIMGKQVDSNQALREINEVLTAKLCTEYLWSGIE